MKCIYKVFNLVPGAQAHNDFYLRKEGKWKEDQCGGRVRQNAVSLGKEKSKTRLSCVRILDFILE